MQIRRSLSERAEEQRGAAGLARLDDDEIVAGVECVGIGGLRFHRNACRVFEGRELGTGAHLEGGDGLVAPTLTFRPSGRVNTAVTVPSSA